MVTVAQAVQKEIDKHIKKLDKLHDEYRAKMGKMVSTPISSREGFDICKPEYIRKGLKYLPPQKVKQEEYISDMLKVCATCAAKQRDIPKPKRPMNSWNCFLKQCAANTEKTFPQCMQDKTYKDKEYTPNKEKYAELAREGCPT